MTILATFKIFSFLENVRLETSDSWLVCSFPTPSTPLTITLKRYMLGHKRRNGKKKETLWSLRLQEPMSRSMQLHYIPVTAFS